MPSPTITVDNSAFVSSQSRAQVQAELAHYRQSRVNPWSTSYSPLRAFQGAKTRAEVTGDYIDSRGQVAALTGEDSGSAFLARSRSVATATTLAGQPGVAL